MRIVILFLLSISCQTGLAQKRLVPVEYNSNEEPEVFAEKSGNGLTVYAECFEVKKDLLVFDIEVINESGRVVSVKPEEIYYYGLDNSQHPIYAESENSVNNYYEKKIRKRKNTKSFLGILSTSLIIFDAISAGQDFRSEPTRQRVNKSIARNVGITASLIAIDIADEVIAEKEIQADEDLYFLPEEILIPGPLRPGESARGKVYFRQNDKHDFYRVTIPVEDQLFEFDFRWPTSVENRVLERF